MGNGIQGVQSNFDFLVIFIVIGRSMFEAKKGCLSYQKQTCLKPFIIRKNYVGICSMSDFANLVIGRTIFDV